ncbi:MAG: ribosome maturation factor RimP [Peptococcaceae bacterium]|nr:ribosome maturation factor RimP [Peptococcaceae bacterium]
MSNNIATSVFELSAPLVDELGYELVDVEFVKEGDMHFLRFYIDKPSGIKHEDCEIVSRKLDVLLDEKDPIPQAYFMEVSSPGLERPLKKTEDFIRFKGHLVKVTTFSPINGKKKIIGSLLGLENDLVLLEDKGKIVSIPIKQMASCRLHVDF